MRKEIEFHEIALQLFKRCQEAYFYLPESRTKFTNLRILSKNLEIPSKYLPVLYEYFISSSTIAVTLFRDSNFHKTNPFKLLDIPLQFLKVEGFITLFAEEEHLINYNGTHSVAAMGIILDILEDILEKICLKEDTSICPIVMTKCFDWLKLPYNAKTIFVSPKQVELAVYKELFTPAELLKASVTHIWEFGDFKSRIKRVEETIKRIQDE